MTAPHPLLYPGESPTVNIPSKEAVEYGRRVIGQERERMVKFMASSHERGDQEAWAKWKRVVFVIDRFLMSDAGCTITPFDERWLDDEFRAVMEQVAASGTRRESSREA